MDKKRLLDLFSLEGKVAIVTGGAGRLGYYHLEALKIAGAILISFDINQNNKLEGIAQQMIVDISEPSEIYRAVVSVINQYRKIDILINNAAVNSRRPKNLGEKSAWGPYEDFPRQTWEQDIKIGLTGAQICIQAVSEFMIPANSGAIINISSTSGITAPNHSKYPEGQFKPITYPVIKTALLGLTRAWASYFAKVAPGVRINSLCPGSINFGSTEPEFVKKLGQRNMLGRQAKPDEYQGTIIFLCSEASSFITASTLVADAGQSAW